MPSRNDWTPLTGPHSSPICGRQQLLCTSVWACSSALYLAPAQRQRYVSADVPATVAVQHAACRNRVGLQQHSWPVEHWPQLAFRLLQSVDAAAVPNALLHPEAGQFVQRAMSCTIPITTAQPASQAGSSGPTPSAYAPCRRLADLQHQARPIFWSWLLQQAASRTCPSQHQRPQQLACAVWPSPTQPRQRRVRARSVSCTPCFHVHAVLCQAVYKAVRCSTKQ